MTERLYLSDAYTAKFTARILERHHLQASGGLAVVLDRSAFMPAINGLLADRGTLNDVQVVDVIEDDKGRLLHVISQDPWADEVQGQVNWPRRFDVMQHHTAQHVLSEAMAQLAGVETLAAGVSPQTAWIEVDKLESEAILERAETWVNQFITTARPVRVAMVDAARAASLPGLSTKKLANGQQARVFNIEGLSLSVCDAVHVARVSELGLFRIERVSRAGERPRIEFKCGIRVVDTYRYYVQLVARLASLLGVPPEGLEKAMLALKAQADQKMEAFSIVYEKMLEYEGVALGVAAEKVGKVKLVNRVFVERDPVETRGLVRKLGEQPGLVIMIGTAGPRAQLFFGRSEDVDWDMNVLMKAAAPVLGTQGGGQARWAESLPVNADVERVEAAIAKAYKLLQAKR